MYSIPRRALFVMAIILHNTLVFCQTPDCPTQTFFKTYGSETQTEIGTVLTKSGDGNLYLAGRNVTKTFIQKISLAGEVIWMREFRINPFEPITPIQIFEDSEGMIVGCGTQTQFAGATRGYVFRYDPVSNLFLWAHPISSSNPLAGGILEKAIGGNFIYYQNSVLSDGETDIEILELQRATGNILPAFASRYEHISYDVMTKMVMVNGALYGLGSVEGRDSFNNTARRLMLARFDPLNGSPVWAQLSHDDTTAQSDFIARDLLADSNTLVAAYLVDEDIHEPPPPGNSFPNVIHLQKTDLDGNILWVKKYDLNTTALRVISVADGYVLSGQRVNNSKYFVFKVNKDGAFIWGKNLSYGPNASPNTTALGPDQSVAVADSLYFTGVATTGFGDVLLWKMLADGSMADSCGYVDSLVLEAIDIQNPVTTPIDLLQLISSTAAANSMVPWTTNTLEEHLICPDCTIPNPCPAGNDFIIDLKSIACSGNSVNMELSICELAGGMLPDLSITFYDGNPYIQGADKIGIYNYNSSNPDSCATIQLVNLENQFGTNAVQNGFQIFAVVNDLGSTNTPFLPNNFPLSDIEECNYFNNLDSITVQLPVAPKLNLGLDQLICSNEFALINAGPGFIKYQWSNGASTQSINTSFAGLYYITATDACGFQQLDTVKIQVRQTPFWVENASFCPGKSVTVHGFSFNQAGTFQKFIPGIGNDCDTSTTFFITQLPYEERIQVVYFCPYETVTINGIDYQDSGLVLDTVSSAVTCDTIVYYLLNQLPFPFRNFHFDICPGSSVTFNGQVYTEPISFTDTLLSSGIGCDTIAHVSIAYLPIHEVSKLLTFCPGTSVEIDGQFYTQPGVVTGMVPSSTGGCDTLVTYTLQYLTPPPSTLSLACPANMNVATTPGTGPIPVVYDLPVASSNCLCPGNTLSLTNGPASGALFTVGNTQVCYKAKDNCGSIATCCFTVTVREELPCDTKTNGCIRYDLLGITADAQQRRTYYIRVTNNCASKLIYTAIQLPDGLSAVAPANLSVFSSSEGRKYTVRNPNYSPFYSIRFKSTTDSISNGGFEVFEYTLPAQANPTFIDITSRLVSQNFYEAHLNTFNCPIGVTHSQNRSAEEDIIWSNQGSILLFPNPTNGELFADLSAWQGEDLTIRILDSRGMRLQSFSIQASREAQSIPLTNALPAGLYFLEVVTEDGGRKVGRFVLER